MHQTYHSKLKYQQEPPHPPPEKNGSHMQGNYIIKQASVKFCGKLALLLHICMYHVKVISYQLTEYVD